MLLLPSKLVACYIPLKIEWLHSDGDDDPFVARSFVQAIWVGDLDLAATDVRRFVAAIVDVSFLLIFIGILTGGHVLRTTFWVISVYLHPFKMRKMLLFLCIFSSIGWTQPPKISSYKLQVDTPDHWFSGKKAGKLEMSLFMRRSLTCYLQLRMMWLIFFWPNIPKAQLQKKTKRWQSTNHNSIPSFISHFNQNDTGMLHCIFMVHHIHIYYIYTYKYISWFPCPLTCKITPWRLTSTFNARGRSLRSQPILDIQADTWRGSVSMLMELIKR